MNFNEVRDNAEACVTCVPSVDAAMKSSRGCVTFPRSRVLTLPPVSMLVTSAPSKDSLDSSLSDASLDFPLLDSAHTLVSEAIKREEVESMTSASSKRNKRKRNCVRRKRKSLADVFHWALFNSSMTSLATESTSGYCSPDTALTHLRTSSIADVARTASFRFSPAPSRDCVSLYDVTASRPSARTSCARSVVSAHVSLYDDNGEFRRSELPSGARALPPWKSRRSRRFVLRLHDCTHRKPS